MHTLILFYHALAPNLKFIWPVLGYEFIVAVVGFILFRRLVDEDSWFIIFPASVISGIFSLILFLGIFSYVFKGPLGIAIILCLFIGFGFVLSFRQKWLFKLKWPIFSSKGVVILFITVCWFLFISLTAGNNIYGGDVIAYWGFATSFANGNYPLMSPWQPWLLANHHQGGFLFEGAMFALTGVNISLIHTLFSVTVISAGLFLLWGMIRKLTGYTVLSVVPALVFYIAFSAIFIPLPTQVEQFLPSEAINQITNWPIFTDAKNRLGGSSNLNEIFYINHRATAFAGMFLILFLLGEQWKISDGKKLLFLTTLVIPVMSTDEVVLPSLLLGIFFWWLQLLWGFSKKVRLRWLLLSGGALIVFVSLFFIIGSALRDSMLTPSPEAPRFQIILKPDFLAARLKEMNGDVLEGRGYILYLPSLFIYFLLAFMGVFFTKRKEMWIYLLAAVGATMAFLVAEHTFYPNNQGRFLHLVYLILGFVISSGGILLLRNNKYRLVGGLLLLLFVPALITSGVALSLRAKAADYPNFNGLQPDYAVLRWSRDHLKGKRIFFIDGYLFDQSFSYLTLYGIQNFGLLIPVSPASVKVHTPDYGVEAVDAVYTLNPQDLKALQIEDVFIKDNQLKRFSSQRLSDLMNPELFREVYSDATGKMYEVEQSYYQSDHSQQPSLYDLKTLVKKGSSIYLDSPPQLAMNLRSTLVLLLKGQAKVYTYQSSGFFNYIETALPHYEPSSEVTYDYLLLSKQTDPKTVSNLSYALIWQLGELRLYELKK